MRVAIVGSRGYPDLDKVAEYVCGLPPGTIVVSGGAKGVDRTAATVGRANGLGVEEIVPDYSEYGTKAPLVRNREIAEACDRMVAFWDGSSTGTAHVIECARKANKPVEIRTSTPAD